MKLLDAYLKQERKVLCAHMLYWILLKISEMLDYHNTIISACVTKFIIHTLLFTETTELTLTLNN